MRQLIALGRWPVHRAGSASLVVLSAVPSSLAPISSIRSDSMRVGRQ